MFDGLFQPTHLLLMVGIAVFLFGGKKLPELGRGLGQGIRGFKAALHDEEPVGVSARPDTVVADGQNIRSAS